MSDRRTRLAVILVALAACGGSDPVAEPAGESTSPACDLTEARPAAFTGPTANDTIVVSVAGDPCHDGTFSIRIRNSTGSTVYEYVAPYAQHTVVSSELTGAMRLIERTLTSGFRSTSTDLPPFATEAMREQQGLDYRAVTDRETYNRLKASGLPMFWHLTHYEEWRWVVFDPVSGKAVVAAEGGSWG